jgi:protein gp37
MSDKSQIEWTDATWNPVRGCEKVSPGCAHCYAETFAERFRGVTGHPYEQGFDLRLVPEKLEKPLNWKQPRRVFVNSMSDLFHEAVPDNFIDRVFAVMALCPQHTFQVLTKRAARMRAYFESKTEEPRNGHIHELDLRERIDDAAGEFGACHANLDTSDRWPLPNVWLGVSVENQHFADERIPLLLQTPAAVRFISAEPLLGSIDLWNLRGGTFDALTGCGDQERLTVWEDTPRLDWVIVGGESGPGARACQPHWIRSIVRRCRAARVPVFVKQLGSRIIDRNDAGFEGDTPRSWPMDTDVENHPNGYREEYQGAPVRVRLRDRKGGTMEEWPEDLRVREFPRALVSA